MLRVLILILSCGYVLALCGLCADDASVDLLRHPGDFVDAKGLTCSQLMINLFRLNRDHDECVHWVRSSRQRCCTDRGLPVIVQLPPPPPPQFVVEGPYKRCDLCGDGGYPSVTSMVINMLYVGPGTCPQYYELGQKGWIQDRLCSPLQYFAREPCGCLNVKPRHLSGVFNYTVSNFTVSKAKGGMHRCIPGV